MFLLPCIILRSSIQYATGHVNIDKGLYFNMEAGCSWSEQAIYAFFQASLKSGRNCAKIS